mmetsp:Transcript_29559/g.74301  ORF Transcript_29559/g.74301 Transcript_29559/m.74301 type:complete len:140 (-) Transcript_29559:89-508(-)
MDAGYYRDEYKTTVWEGTIHSLSPEFSFGRYAALTSRSGEPVYGWRVYELMLNVMAPGGPEPDLEVLSIFDDEVFRPRWQAGDLVIEFWLQMSHGLTPVGDGSITIGGASYGSKVEPGVELLSALQWTWRHSTRLLPAL